MNAKRSAGNRIAILTMSATEKSYRLWQKQTAEWLVLKKAEHVTKILEHCRDVVSNNFEILMSG